MTPQDKLEKIRKRQTRRLLCHLERTGQITPGLRCDVMRSMSYVFGDVADLMASVTGEPLPPQEHESEWRPGQ
jgi:hypothetical protein